MAKARKIFVSLQWKDFAANENKVRGRVERIQVREKAEIEGRNPKDKQ